MRNKKSVLKTSRLSSGSFRVVANVFGLGEVAEPKAKLKNKS